jgi:hypothetical protein
LIAVEKMRAALGDLGARSQKPGARRRIPESENDELRIIESSCDFNWELRTGNSETVF